MYINLVVILSVDWHNRSAAHQILYIAHSSHTLHKKCKCNEAVHQLFTDFKTAYDSVRWQVFYNTLSSLVYS